MPGRTSLGIRFFLLTGSVEEAPAKEKPHTRIFIATFYLLVAWRVRDRALDEARDFKRSTNSFDSGSIPVRGQRSRNWRDCKGEAAKNSTCQNEAEGGQRRPSTNRALFSDQFSELDDEITSPVMYLPPIEMLWLPLVWRSVALCIIQSA